MIAKFVIVLAIAMFILTCVAPMQAATSSQGPWHGKEIARVQGPALAAIFLVCSYVRKHDGLDCGSRSFSKFQLDVFQSDATSPDQYGVLITPMPKPSDSGRCTVYSVNVTTASVDEHPCL